MRDPEDGAHPKAVFERRPIDVSARIDRDAATGAARCIFPGTVRRKTVQYRLHPKPVDRRELEDGAAPAIASAYSARCGCAEEIPRAVDGEVCLRVDPVLTVVDEIMDDAKFPRTVR